MNAMRSNRKRPMMDLVSMQSVEVRPSPGPLAERLPAGRSKRGGIGDRTERAAPSASAAGSGGRTP